MKLRQIQLDVQLQVQSQESVRTGEGPKHNLGLITSELFENTMKGIFVNCDLNFDFSN